jgi:hypothetical protein
MESTFKAEKMSKKKNERTKKYAMWQAENYSMVVGRCLGSVVDILFNVFNSRRRPGSVVLSSVGRCTPSPLRGPAPSPPLSTVAITTPVERRVPIPVLVAVVSLRASTRAARALTISATSPVGRRRAPVVTPYRRGRIFCPLEDTSTKKKLACSQLILTWILKREPSKYRPCLRNVVRLDET